MTAEPSLEHRCREAVQRVRDRLAELAKERGHGHDTGLSFAAKELGITRQAVALWRDRIPLDHVYALADLTGISPHEQRPDVIPRRLKPGPKANGKRRPRTTS